MYPNRVNIYINSYLNYITTTECFTEHKQLQLKDLPLSIDAWFAWFVAKLSFHTWLRQSTIPPACVTVLTCLVSGVEVFATRITQVHHQPVQAQQAWAQQQGGRVRVLCQKHDHKHAQVNNQPQYKCYM